MNFGYFMPQFISIVETGFNWCNSVIASIPWFMPLMLGLIVSALAVSYLVVPALGIGFRGVSTSERRKK